MTEQTRYPGTPRWVKWLGGATILVAAAIIVLHLTGHGFGHGQGHGMTTPGEPQS